MKMSFVAIRGSSALSDEVELCAHIAALLRLENVGLLLGAGASVHAGGLTMKALWEKFLEEEPADATWLKDAKFITDSAVAIGSERVIPNVEDLADRLEIAIAERKRVGEAVVADLERVRASLFRAIVNAALLFPQWWSSPEGAEGDPDRLKHHRTILQKFVAARQPGQAPPWVFTTNYDLAVEWAAESIDLQVVNGFLGVHGRRFSPQSFDLGFRNTQARGEARFGVYNIYLAKLHGSLSWKEVNGQLIEVPAQLAWQSIQKFISDKTVKDLGLMVLPRAAKYIQTVGFVLGELLRRFSEFLSRPQTCLFISGYGFGDEHINRLLRSALLNPTLQTIIYFPDFDGNASDPALPPALIKLIGLNNPRITIIGGGSSAYIDQFSKQLPDPLLYDEEMRKLAAAIRSPSGND